MDKEQLIAQLAEIMSDIIDCPVEFTEQTTAADIEKWDSLVQMSFMLIIEQTYEIELGLDEITHFANIGELADMIIKKKGA